MLCLLEVVVESYRMNAIWWENLEVASTFLGKYNLPFRKNIDIEPAFTFRSHSIVPLKKGYIIL